MLGFVRFSAPSSAQPRACAYCCINSRPTSGFHRPEKSCLAGNHRGNHRGNHSWKPFVETGLVGTPAQPRLDAQRHPEHSNGGIFSAVLLVRLVAVAVVVRQWLAVKLFRRAVLLDD